jgi:hypothetical protein
MSVDLAGEQKPARTVVADRVGHPVGHRDDTLTAALAVHDQRPTVDIDDQIFAGAHGDFGAAHAYLASQAGHHAFPGAGRYEEFRPHPIRAWSGTRFVSRDLGQTIYRICCSNSILATPIVEPNERCPKALAVFIGIRFAVQCLADDREGEIGWPDGAAAPSDGAYVAASESQRRWPQTAEF